MLDQTYRDTAHLLRRAGFGAGPDEIRMWAQKGLPQTTDALLHPEQIPDTLDDQAILSRLAELAPEQRGRNNQVFLPVQIVKMWWAHRMIASPHPLVEKMTLFWHGHFTSKDGGRQGDLMLAQNRMFRQNALGNFRTLTLAVSRDPEMLRYLNGNQNYKAHPNENYGRELMELFTCGIGHYTEDDVKAAARAFSGWNLRQGEFVFNANQHDNDPKTFLGKTGNWNGDDIVDILVAHPATARRLCTQLFSYLAYPSPEPAVLDALVRTYYSSGYDIRALVGQILRSKAFYSDKARNAVIKCPVQYVIGSVKMLGLESAFAVQPRDITMANDMAAAPGSAATGATAAQRQKGRRLAGLALLPMAMRAMGQDILEPPSVKGWDGGPSWINSSTLLARINFANQLSFTRDAFDGRFMQATAFVQEKGLSDPGAWVDFLAETLGPLTLTPPVRQMLVDYVGGVELPGTEPAQVQPAAADQTPALLPRGQRPRLGAGYNRRIAEGKEGRLRGAIPLIMATPEFQVC